MKAKSKTLIEEKEKLKKFYVSYDEQSEITRERDPDDEWDGDDTSTMISFENAFIAWDGETSAENPQVVLLHPTRIVAVIKTIISWNGH